MVATVVCACVLAVMQLAFVMYVRNTLRDCASDAARYAALDNRGLVDGETRARILVTQALSARFAGDITSRTGRSEGAETVEVTIDAAMPVLGPIGGPVRIRAVGHGIKDAR